MSVALSLILLLLDGRPGVLATYAPLIHANMAAKLRALVERHPSLRFNFCNSIYPATSFNFGPATVCVDHTDAQNDPCNFCHITALGDFDPSLSRLIILHDAKLIVRFPPGSSILIPSTIMRHGNTPISLHETRMSLTQYCAGGLLRWVECGFRTVGNLAKEDPRGSAAYRANLRERASRCAQLFSTLGSLPLDLTHARQA